MSTLQTVILITHTLIAILIIALVLIQRGKGAAAGGANRLGLGARSLTLAYLSSQTVTDTPTSLIESVPISDDAQPVETDTDALPDLPALEAVDGDTALPEIPPLESSEPEEQPQ